MLPEDGCGLLHAAAEGSNLTAVRLLVEKYGADVNLQAESGATPLLIAAQAGNYDVCSFLLKAGADASFRNGGGKKK